MRLLHELHLHLDELHGLGRLKGCFGTPDGEPAVSSVLRPWGAALLTAMVVTLSAAGLQLDARDHNPSDIGSRIAAAFERALLTGDLGGLEAIATALRSPSSRGERYWSGLAHYRLADALISAGELASAEVALREAVAALEAIEPHDSESRALHALAAGMALGFTPRERMVAALGPVIESLMEAVRLDPNNPRAHYANAMADYRTPAEQGGGERIEEFLSKALAGFAAADAGRSETARPTWGEEDTIALALSYYRREGRPAAASALYATAAERFPASAVLAQFRGQFGQ